VTANGADDAKLGKKLSQTDREHGWIRTHVSHAGIAKGAKGDGDMVLVVISGKVRGLGQKEEGKCGCGVNISPPRVSDDYAPLGVE